MSKSRAPVAIWYRRPRVWCQWWWWGHGYELVGVVVIVFGVITGAKPFPHPIQRHICFSSK